MGSPPLKDGAVNGTESATPPADGAVQVNVALFSSWDMVGFPTLSGLLIDAVIIPSVGAVGFAAKAPVIRWKVERPDMNGISTRILIHCQEPYMYSRLF